MTAVPMPDDPSREPLLRALPGGAALGGALPASRAGAADGTLLERARRGDREAFGTLVERHHLLLAAMVRQHVGPRGPVEDLVQDTFVKALRGIGGFRGSSSFSTWAVTIAVNLSRDWLRKTSRRKRLAPPADVDQSALPDRSGRAAGSDLETREEAARIREAMTALPEHVRAAISLRVVEDLPYEQIAERLGTVSATARTWVSRGLRTVRAQVAQTTTDATLRGERK